ncbi:helix-turn-helix transcriptional regulator [Ensifer sp. 4252]|uniref:helix-turn-helix transcriptional regulator n=1 Tax=Ensifer sp. 4252 TaxID=3373915 RepID=UPI003D2163E6
MPNDRSCPPKVNHRRLSLSLSALRSAKHREDVRPALNELCSRYDMSHMTFLVVRSGGASSSFPYYCTTYPDAWTATYLDSGYLDIDPVIDVIRWGFLPVDWSSLDRKSGEAHRLFNEARSHGVGSQGLTIPIRGSNGERCLFSVASTLPRREWARLRDASIYELQVLSHYLHETVFHVTGYRRIDRYRKLSGRETQCLQLLATGRISKQIAADLQISEHAVKLYLRSARLKLGAVTSHNAVAKASLLELIDV